MGNNEKLLDLIEQVRLSFAYIKHLGVETISCSESSLILLNSWDDIVGFGDRARCGSLANIETDMKDCKQCELCQQRSNIVFGEGSKSAKLVFVGEGPGFDEDKSGRPFVGKAGQLLTRIIEAMGLSRNEVYICNIVKCHPPGNRNPSDKEIEKCIPFLNQQISFICPDFICALGAVAAKSLLKVNTPISRLRGNFISLPNMQHIKVMPTYHPAYLLRNPGKKRDVWEDMKKIMEVMA